jgi:hypothetical protein
MFDHAIRLSGLLINGDGQGVVDVALDREVRLRHDNRTRGQRDFTVRAAQARKIDGLTTIGYWRNSPLPVGSSHHYRRSW